MNRLNFREARGIRGERFARAYTRARADLGRMSEQGARDIERLIRDLRAEVQDILRSARPVDGELPFIARRLPEIIREIDVAVAELARRGGQAIDERIGEASELGGGVTHGAFAAAGIDVLRPIVDPGLVSTLTTNARDTFAEMSGRLGARIERSLRRSAIGFTPSSRAIRDIEKELRTSAEVARGFRRRIGFGFQAETIARTEIGRAYSNAQQAASEQISETIPGLKKRWVTSQGRRSNHRQVEKRYSPGADPGPIPVKQHFRVPDTSRTGTTEFLTTRPPGGGQRVARVEPYTRRGRVVTDRMLFPRDPSASAGNIVNCSCISMETVDDLDGVASQAAGVVEAPPPEEIRPVRPDFREQPLGEALDGLRGRSAEVRRAVASAGRSQLRRADRAQTALLAKEEEFRRLRAQEAAEEAERTRREYLRIQRELDRLRQEVVNLKRQALAAPNPSTPAMRFATSTIRGERRARVEDARRFLGSLIPADSADLAAIPEIIVRATRRRRAYSSGDSVFIPRGEDTGTAAHEMGHVLENNPRILRRATEFFERRTAGEQAQRLRELQPQLRYDADEFAKPDEFVDPYMGKVYRSARGGRADIDEGRPIRATEIVSMGVEALYRNPGEFATRDPEYFDFIRGLLAGEL